jgi:hypothetical protein
MKIGAGIPFEQPASTNAYEFIVDPMTTSVIGSEDVITPDVQPIPNVCPGLPGKLQYGYVAPHWSSVLSQGVVGSDTSTMLLPSK